MKVDASSDCFHPNTCATAISITEKLGLDKAIETDPPIGRHIQTKQVKSAHKKSGSGITCVSSSSQPYPCREHMQSELYTNLLTLCVANEHKINLLLWFISQLHEWMPENDIT